MLQRSAQIVSTQSLSPEMGARFCFWASRPSLSAAWLALLLTKAGDVESNPGPTTHTQIHALNSDHLPMITTINTRTKYKLQQNKHTFTNYRKANWTQFTTDTEAAFSGIQPPPDIHTANTIFTNIILHADKHNIPKGKIHST